jgi:HEAT repeat protein
VVAPFLCQYAPLLAPTMAPLLPGCGATAARVVLRMLGFGGAGYETAIAGQLGRGDEQTDREALRALARIGTSKAADVVVNELRNGSAGSRAAAEEALWHLPPAQAAAQLRDILGSRDFVVRHPQVAGRLIERAGQTGAEGLAPVLETIAPLRFRFWNPSIVRVARKARELLNR